MIRAIFSCVAVIAASLPALGDAAAEARRQIQAAYNRENAAAARKDASGVLANLTSDYKSISANGQTVTAEVLRQRLPIIFASAVSVKGTSTIIKLALKGKQADVQVKEHGILVLMNRQTKKRSKLEIHDVSQTLWVKTPSGWKKKQSRTLSSKQLLDGKPLPQR
jgi:hypothetical protein